MDVVVVDVDVEGRIELAEVSGRGTVLEVEVTSCSVVVVLASARSPATSEGSGGTAPRAGAHDAHQRIPTVTTARRRGLTRP